MQPSSIQLPHRRPKEASSEVSSVTSARMLLGARHRAYGRRSDLPGGNDEVSELHRREVERHDEGDGVDREGPERQIRHGRADQKPTEDQVSISRTQRGRSPYW